MIEATMQRMPLGRPLARRNSGVLAVRHHRPLSRHEGTGREVRADGGMRTGDVAALDAHGDVRIAGRTEDLIKSGAEWISSVDMENLLMAHPAVLEAAVVAVPDAKWGERPVAFVVFKTGRAATADELRVHLATHFAKWQLPDRSEVLDAIARTSTGKFFKAKLRERARTG